MRFAFVEMEILLFISSIVAGGRHLKGNHPAKIPLFSEISLNREKEREVFQLSRQIRLFRMKITGAFPVTPVGTPVQMFKCLNGPSVPHTETEEDYMNTWSDFKCHIMRFAAIEMEVLLFTARSLPARGVALREGGQPHV